MEYLRAYTEKLYDFVRRDFDRIIPVVGDEGYGKSTLILEAIWLYELARENDPTPATVLNAVIFDDREAFRQKLLGADPTDPIALMDAAHVLYKRDTMMPDQKETERTLLDIRFDNYVIFMGYQDWSDIPDQLQRRRAKNLLRIPRRGIVEGYGRDELDDKYDSYGKSEWPDPVFKDTFPSLEGTEIWSRFQQVDTQRKRARLQNSDDDEEEELSPQDVVEDILNQNPAQYVEVYNERAYYNKSLIRYDFPELTDRQAEQVQAALKRECNPSTLVTDTHAHG